MEKYWLVSKRATVRVVVDHNIVIEAAPLVKAFIGQPFYCLRNWFYRRFGPVSIECEWDYER